MFDLSMISDLLLAGGAIAAATYCVVLAGRLKRFNNLESGMGGAVAVLSAQVDDMTKTLQKAQRAAVSSSVHLTELTERAEAVSQRMELMLASMHDLPSESDVGPVAGPAAAPVNEADKTTTNTPPDDSRPDVLGPNRGTAERDQEAEPAQEPAFARGSSTRTAAESPAPETDQPVFLSRRQVMEAAE